MRAHYTNSQRMKMSRLLGYSGLVCSDLQRVDDETREGLARKLAGQIADDVELTPAKVCETACDNQARAQQGLYRKPLSKKQPAQQSGPNKRCVLNGYKFLSFGASVRHRH